MPLIVLASYVTYELKVWQWGEMFTLGPWKNIIFIISEATALGVSPSLIIIKEIYFEALPMKLQFGMSRSANQGGV